MEQACSSGRLIAALVICNGSAQAVAHSSSLREQTNLKEQTEQRFWESRRVCSAKIGKFHLNSACRIPLSPGRGESRRFRCDPQTKKKRKSATRRAAIMNGLPRAAVPDAKCWSNRITWNAGYFLIRLHAMSPFCCLLDRDRERPNRRFQQVHSAGVQSSVEIGLTAPTLPLEVRVSVPDAPHILHPAGWHGINHLLW